MGIFGTAKSVLVVDTSAVLKTKGVRGRAAPRQQIQLLRALSRIVQREKFKVTAVLVGEPLDKAPHNKVFDHVRVRYASSEDLLNNELLKALKQAGSGGVLVTEDPALEGVVLRSGGNTLRVSTFRTLLEDSAEPNENNAGNGRAGGSSQRKNRRDRDRNRDSRQPRDGNSPQTQPQQQRPENANAGERNRGDNDINEMIDLIQ